MAAAQVNPDFCSCALFLNEWGDGRIETFQDCPCHWRLFEDEFTIPRESAPVDPDELLALVQG